MKICILEAVFQLAGTYPGTNFTTWMFDASASCTTCQRHGIVISSLENLSGLDLLGLSCSCYELLVPNSSQHNLPTRNRSRSQRKSILYKCLQLVVCKICVCVWVIWHLWMKLFKRPIDSATCQSWQSWQSWQVARVLLQTPRTALGRNAVLLWLSPPATILACRKLIQTAHSKQWSPHCPEKSSRLSSLP